MLDVKCLGFSYPDKQILNDIHFSLQAGALLHLRGENGSGKTTLLKILAGLYAPEEGGIWYQSNNVLEDIAWYQQQICYVGHKTGISLPLTVKENCLFNFHYTGDNLACVLEQFDLERLADTYCSQLSAGQKRRVGLLRLALSNASLWLLDEPLVALDEQAISLLMRQLQRHVTAGGQVILTSHQAIPELDVPYKEYYL